MLNSELKDIYELIHLDISDHRDLGNIGKWDFENFRIGFRNIFDLTGKLLLHKPDMVYLAVAHNNIAFLRDASFIIISKILSGARILIHCRSGNYFNRYKDNNIFMKAVMNIVYGSCDSCIVLGINLKNMMSKWFKDEDIFVIPNGTSFKVDLKRKKCDDSVCNIGYIGFFGREKGTDYLIKGFKLLADKYPNVNLFIAGEYINKDKDFKSLIDNFISENKLSDRIKFCGVLKGKEKEDFFLNLDIFLFPSAVYPFWVEGHPNAILEAMAAGLPIIATDVGAISESVKNNFNGFLIRDKNIDDIFEKTSYLIDNKNIRYEMGRNSYDWQKSEFNDETNFNNLDKAFKSVLNKN